MMKTRILAAFFFSVGIIVLKAEPYASLETQLRNCPTSMTDGTQSASFASAMLAYEQSGDAQTITGLRAIISEKLYLTLPASTENPALSLFARLLATSPSHPAVKSGDSIVAAIVLANNYLYSIADDAAKTAIVSDCLAQADFYDDIIAWQGKEKLAYSLSAAPLPAKILWADRLGPSQGAISESMNLRSEAKMSLEVYRAFVDRPENLLSISKIVRDRKLFRTSISATASLLEAFVHRERTYRSSMENLEDFNRRKVFSDAELAKARAEYAAGGYEREYFGKKRRWDAFIWLNYQYALFTEKGKFQGDCGTTTVVQMAFYRAAGIAPVSLQWINVDRLPAFTHNFPGYYHPYFSRWFSIQKPVFNENGGTVISLPVSTYLHYTKPVWHAWKFPAKYETPLDSKGRKSISYAFYPGELADQFRITSLLTLGIEAAVFEASFFSNSGLTKNVLLTDASAPSQLADSDYDSLPDALEKNHGTNGGKPDTDGDRYADLWEIENGFDPEKPNDIPPGTIALDGLASPAEYGVEGASTGAYVTDPVKDYKSTKYVYDTVASFGSASEGKLHCAVLFGSPIARNPVKLHSFLIVPKGGDGKRYWVQWYRDYAQVYEIRGTEYVPLGGDGLEASWLQAAEFNIPLSYFGPAEALVVRYFACGYYDGKDQIVDDSCDAFRVILKTGDFANTAPCTLAAGIATADPRGDAEPKIRNPLDVKEFSHHSDGTWLTASVSSWEPAPFFGLKTIYVRDDAKKFNWWIQWWNSAEMGVWAWKDGEPLKPLAVDDKSFDSFSLGSVTYFRIPLSLFQGAENLKMRYHSGGFQDTGSAETNVDITEFSPL